jgi:hypothetical protein
MKSSVRLITLAVLVLPILSAVSAEAACPNLSGNYLCTDDQGTHALTITQSGNRYTLVQDGMTETVIADGVKRALPADSGLDNGTASATCTNSNKLEYVVEGVSEGQHLMSKSHVFINSAKQLQSDTTVYYGGSPIQSATQVCARN